MSQTRTKSAAAPRANSSTEASTSPETEEPKDGKEEVGGGPQVLASAQTVHGPARPSPFQARTRTQNVVPAGRLPRMNSEPEGSEYAPEATRGVAFPTATSTV